MRDLPDLLFSESDLSLALRGSLEQAKKDVNEVPEEQFLHSSDEEIIEHVLSKCEVIPVTLDEDRKQMEMHEIQVDARNDPLRPVRDNSRPCLIPGVCVTVTVPFEGDAGLWKCRPSRFSLSPPRANVRAGRGDCGGHIDIIWECPSDSVGDGAVIKREVDSTLNSIKEYLEWIRRDVQAHNQQLRGHIRACSCQRRQRLGKHTEIAKALNIPLKRKPGAPDLAPLPMKRKLVKPLPPPPNRPSEPGIGDEDYSHILSVIRHEGRSFETTPRTFAKHDEEELRDIILAHLNGHYEGQATGETFRKTGKTDIRIEDQSRAAFVAECKVWKGESELSKGLDQLLGYLTWRDCKGALVIFSTRNAKFTELQAKVPVALRAHKLFLSEVPNQEAGEWRFRMRSLEDEDRTVLIHVFLFNLYSKE
jgi:hypothetical protein